MSAVRSGNNTNNNISASLLVALVGRWFWLMALAADAVQEQSADDDDEASRIDDSHDCIDSTKMWSRNMMD
jgi:hypothetical protein